MNIGDFRTLARKRLPKAIFDYVDGGAEDEITLRENCRAFSEITFRPRHAVAVPKCDLHTQVLGANLAFPALLAPVGYSRLFHPDGERGAAIAAGSAGTAYILSTVSGYKLEDIRAAATGPVWYQLYLIGGRAAAEGAIDRAQRAGFSALVITIDSPVAGMRERDHHNGAGHLLGNSLSAKLPYLSQFVLRPGWVAAHLRDGGVPPLHNVVLPNSGPMPLIDVPTALAQAVVTWDDLDWIKAIWKGPIVMKGVLTGDDARRSIDCGASAVVVSNHGGRQLDGLSASLRALPEVVQAVNGKVEVLMDGGVRRGADIVKAICLGARAVLIGRAYAYALAAAGQAGVNRALQILRADVERTLKLLGCPSVSALDASYIEARPR